MLDCFTIVLYDCSGLPRREHAQHRKGGLETYSIGGSFHDLCLGFGHSLQDEEDRGLRGLVLHRRHEPLRPLPAQQGFAQGQVAIRPVPASAGAGLLFFISDHSKNRTR